MGLRNYYSNDVSKDIRSDLMPELTAPFETPGKRSEDRYYEREGRIEHWRWRSGFPSQWILVKIFNSKDNDEMEFAQ